MPAKGSYDPITNPMRQGAKPCPKVETNAPAIWASKPASASGIPCKYSYPSGQGPTGPAPQFKT